jgi:hypothetical protein
VNLLPSNSIATFSIASLERYVALQRLAATWGESIEITDRGRPVARLVPITADPCQDLVSAGEVVASGRSLSPDDITPHIYLHSASKALSSCGATNASRCGSTWIPLPLNSLLPRRNRKRCNPSGYAKQGQPVLGGLGPHRTHPRRSLEQAEGRREGPKPAAPPDMVALTRELLMMPAHCCRCGFAASTRSTSSQHRGPRHAACGRRLRRRNALSSSRSRHHNSIASLGATHEAHCFWPDRAYGCGGLCGVVSICTRVEDRS